MKNVRSTFRVLFLLRESRIKKDGLSSLMIRITINKDKFELSSQLSIDSKTWDAKAGKVSGRSNQAFETNAHIEFIRSRLHKLYIEIQQSDGYVTVDRLRNRYLGVEEQQYTLLKLFDKKITQKEALVGKGISKEKVGVEINLVSNEFTLGVLNDEHPYALYARAGVPMVISTDDPGILRTNLVEQYVLLVLRYGVDYKTVKTLIRNSIHYSFAPSNRKAALLNELNQQLKAFEANWAQTVKVDMSTWAPL